MRRHERDIANGAILDFDVCVVGAGPAGLAVAESLSRRGRFVGLLESGGDRVDERARQLSEGEVVGVPYYRLSRVRARALGGSSRLWLRRRGPGHPSDRMRARPLDAIDFERRPQVPEGVWPIGHSELAPWYGEARALCGLVSEVPADSADPQLPGVERTTATFASPAVFRKLATTLGEQPGVSLISGTTVIGFQDKDGSNLGALRVAGESGGWFEARARHFVLAGGGIENARLLLLAPFGRPGARANRHDQVGRYFMEHLHIDSGVLRSGEATRHWQFGLGGFTVDGSRIATGLRVGDAAQRAEGLVNATIEFRDLSRSALTPAGRSRADLVWAVRNRTMLPELTGHLRNVARSPGQLVRGIIEKTNPAAGVQGLVITSEQTPWARSRVTLGQRKDVFGQPVARLEWQIAARDLESVRHTQDLLDRGLQAARLGHITEKWGETQPNPRIDGCSHAIGTTRMSADPSTGVVDANCRVHGLENLWVAGSSVMPTGGAATVTLTLIALAQRLADHLDGVLGR